MLSRHLLGLEQFSLQRRLHLLVLFAHLIFDLFVFSVEVGELPLQLLNRLLLQGLLLLEHGQVFVVAGELTLNLLILDLDLFVFELKLKLLLSEVTLRTHELFQLLRVQLLDVLDLDAGFLSRTDVLLNLSEQDLNLADL